MKDKILMISSNQKIGCGIFKMRLVGDCSEISKPGQFLNIKLDGCFLRRPISILDWDDEWVEIVYKVVGQGTTKMSKMEAGESLQVLLPLGNGYDMSLIPEGALLIAGGVGLPPIYSLTKRLLAIGKTPRVLLGFSCSEQVFGAELFEALGLKPELKIGGYVTDVFDRENYICACGPEPMLKALCDKCDDGQFSFESKMGCGFGACMCCSRETTDGYKRVCKDGPIFFKEEIKW